MYEFSSFQFSTFPISNSGVLTAEGQKITEVAFPGLFQIIDNLYSLSGVDVFAPHLTLHPSVIGLPFLS